MSVNLHKGAVQLREDIKAKNTLQFGHYRRFCRPEKVGKVARIGGWGGGGLGNSGNARIEVCFWL